MMQFYGRKRSTRKLRERFHKLIFPAHQRQRGDDFQRFLIGLLKLSILRQKETGRLLSAGSTAQTKDTTKKRFHLVIGESALLIADYFEWVDKVLISR